MREIASTINEFVADGETKSFRCAADAVEHVIEVFGSGQAEVRAWRSGYTSARTIATLSDDITVVTLPAVGSWEIAATGDVDVRIESIK